MEISWPYIATGGNRHPSAADWDAISGLLAFGAGRNIALCRPLGGTTLGIEALLAGHSDTVNALRFFPGGQDRPIIVSGSADQTVRIWRCGSDSVHAFQCVGVLEDHFGSINCVAVVEGSDIMATGATDSTLKIWRLSLSNDGVSATLLQSIHIQPRLFPLALALNHLGTTGALILASGGTRSIVQTYVTEQTQEIDFVLRATLTGHEGWIRSLDFVHENRGKQAGLLLASASQDKYIRLWRIHQGEDLPAARRSTEGHMLGQNLSNKAHRFEATGIKYSLTFEALLLGHDDWIYTTLWNRNGEHVRLLSASADNSLALWEPDPASGVWVCSTRLGEISAQKGSTTATGSTGGFWIGLWSPDGGAVMSLGRTGSWRIWNHDRDQDQWNQTLGLSGHIKDVKDVAWAKDGSYLLSTSSDQTTRLHAKWKHGTHCSWHEFSRPQIHGYDLNCIDTFRNGQFISGADEKLLRVFDEPGGVANILEKFCGIIRIHHRKMPDAANMPVLGLSNKAVDIMEDDKGVAEEFSDECEALDPTPFARLSTLDIGHPPLEDHLARHTLWPEREKLYGHGYEISAVATSHDGLLTATACKASSIDHAVVRLYDTHGWREVKPSLMAHSLTVTCLRFSQDDKLLLSVGRDRQWTVFERRVENGQIYTFKVSNPKGHARMILGAAWAPSEAGTAFATAGRDKCIKIWKAENNRFVCETTILAVHPVTTVDFHPRLFKDYVILASGTEHGDLTIYTLDRSELVVRGTHTVPPSSCPSLSITRLSWRPPITSDTANAVDKSDAGGGAMLAVASDDSTLRIMSIKAMPMP